MFNLFGKKDKETDKERFEKAKLETQIILVRNKDKNDKIREILENLHKKRESHGHR